MLRIGNYLLTIAILTIYVGYSHQVVNERVIKSVNTFKVESDGNTTRFYEHYAGVLPFSDKKSACLSYCGVNGFKYGAEDGADCFCGDNEADECTASECLTQLDAEGITPGVSSIDENVELFVSTALTENTVEKLLYGYNVYVDGKISRFEKGANLKASFTELGKVNVSLELNGFWFAQSPPKEVDVYVKTTVKIDCPLGVENGTNYDCVFNINSGSEMTSLKVTEDGSTNLEVTEIADPMYFEVGGNMKPDRLNSYPQYTLRDQLLSRVFIDLNNEFESDGFVHGVEAFVTYRNETGGCMDWLILKPTCESPYVYCNAKKKCIDETITWCGDKDDYMTFVTPNESPTFCADAKRFTTTSASSCPSLDSQTEPEVDYTVIHKFKTCTNATVNSNVVWQVNPPLEVKAGYVLGFMASLDPSQDIGIGYYDKDLAFEELRKTLIYKQIKDIIVGSVLPFQYPLVSFSNEIYMVKAYVFAPSAYVHNFVAGSAGSEITIGMDAVGTHSSANTSVKVQILNIISGLEPTLDKYEVYTNETITLSIQVAVGSEFVNYYVHWDYAEFNGTYDASFHYEPTVSISNSYSKVNTYEIYVKAENHISSMSKKIIVNVRGPINSINYFDTVRKILPVPTSTIQSTDAIADGHGLALLNFQNTEAVGTQQMFQLNISLSSYFVLHVEYNYTEHQDVLNMIKVSHPLNQNNIIHAYGSIEDIIDELNLSNYPIIATNDTYTFNIVDHIGTNVTYRWTWEDGTVFYTNGTYNERNMDKVYHNFGNYTIELFAWNQISNLTATFPVTIEDLMYGLAFTLEYIDTIFLQPTNVSFKLQQGTAVNIKIDYGYNGIVSPTAYNMDTVGSAMYGRGSYMYPERGRYNISITCENSVSRLEVIKEVSIEVDIQGFEISLKQEYEGSRLLDYIEENEVLTIITQIDQGDNVMYYYDCGDGRPIIGTTNTSINVTYPRWQTEPKYIIRVTAANLVTNISKEIPIAVQMPVQELVGFKISNDVENSTEPMLMQLTIEGGDFFNCTWNMTDGTVVNTHYPDFLTNNGTIFHQFEAGIYNVSLFCINRLYTISNYTITYSYDPVTTFDIDIYRACEGEDRLPGAGDFEDTYPIECPVMFAISSQKGTNVSYEYDYGYKDKNGQPVTSIEYMKNETYHLYAFTRETNIEKFKINIRAFSPVNEIYREISIEMIESINNVSIKFAEDPVRIGSYANFTVAVTGKPYKPCYTLEFGDKEEKGSSYQPIMFGHLECTSKQEYTFYHYLKGFEDMEPDKVYPLYSYMYNDITVYNAELVGKNLVSNLPVSYPARIRDLPCEKPEVAWDSAIALEWTKAEEKSPFYKCRRYSILTKARKFCVKTQTIIDRSWALRRVKWNNDTGTLDTLEQIEVPGNDTRYVIEPRQLDYGLYEIRFNASMLDLTRERYVLETEAILKGYFVIKKCDLFAKIEGGTGKAVGQNGTIMINASKSSDPDMEPGTNMNLTFEWFCKQKNEGDDEDRAEYFPDNLDECEEIKYPSEPDIATTNKTLDRYHFLGCFGTGVGKLSDEGQSGPILHLNTDFMLYSQSYNIWMRLSQEGREKKEIIKYDLRVVFGVPPLVSIECKLNCEKKQNPTEKTSFVAKCTNCNGVVPIYSWQMFSKGVDAPEEEKYKDDTEVLRKNANVNIDRSKNLVINPDTFEKTKMYIVKLSVFWDEDSYDNGGFSQYAITINSPPKEGPYAGCFPNEFSGKALETKFQLVCEDIDDVDKPLTYYWYFLPGNETEKWREATFPRQGLGLSEQFTLSAGDPKNDNKVKLKVVVADLFGAAMELFLEITVEPKVLDSSAIDAMLGDENAMSDPAVMGNVMNGLLDSLSAPADDTNEEKAEVDESAVKNKMVAMLANVKIDSPSGCSMVAGTLNGASSEGEELGDDAMEKSLKATGNVAGFAGELSPKDLEDIAKKTLSAASKFTSSLNGDNAADNIKKAMDSEAMLTSGSAGNMVAGEIPSPLVTSNGVTKVSCIDPKDASADLGGFALPTSMDDDGDGSDCTGATNPVGKNRYGFDKSSSAVHGGTQGLSLSAGAGKKKKVQNLTQPIRLVLPNKEEIPPPESYLAYCELMRVVHLVECTVNSSNIFMKMKPWYNNFTGNFFVFMNKGTSPSLVDHQHNCTLPNPYPENFANMSSAEQYHFENEERWRCFITQTAMNETCTGRWCVGVIYYTNTTNQTTELKPRDYPVEEAKCPKLNYTFYAYTRSCLYWDEPKKRFSGEGCKASAETKDNETVCYCNHLTDFGGGGPLAEPQPIDFGAALSGFSNLGDNPTVFSVVMALIVVYFLMMVWARRTDKKDVIKNAMYPLEDNHPNDTMFYEISVETGHKSGATSTSEVFIILHGTYGETSPRRLHNPERKCFTKGGIDNFLMAVPYNLGDLKCVELWHNNTGESPGWFHFQTTVRDMETMKKHTFFSNQWFDVGEEDGLISRKIEKSSKSDLKDFNFMFSQNLRQNLYDGHIWFSIFTRPAQSTFTRCQRVSTCFALLLSTMLSNAMFYTGGDEPPTASVKFGPIEVSIAQIKIGITSSLIVIPANLLIITLFKKAGPKKEKGEENIEEKEQVTVAIDLDEKSQANISNIESPIEEEGEDESKKQNSRIAFLASICFAGREDDEDEKLRKKKKPLPHWLIYFGYFAVFVTSAVSGFFVILYGFTFGKPKSDKWIVAMLISFNQSIFLIQPVKVVVLSVIFAVMIKDPSRNENETTSSKPKQKRDSDAEDSELEEEAVNVTKKKKKLDTFKLPDERKLEEARQARLAEKRIKAIIKEVVIHLLFLTLCLMVAYAAADPSSYQLSETTKTLCMKNGITNSYFDGNAYAEQLDDGQFRAVNDAEGVTTRLEWLDWARYSVIEYLFPIGWYNGDKDYNKGFTADTEASKVLAMARFRQLRVKPMSCQKHPVFEFLVEQCNAGYSWGVEDTKHYAPGWQPELNKTMRYRARRGKRKALYLGLETPWRYGTSEELKAFPFVGKHATYSGSSYSVSIGPTKKIAKKIWQSMKDNFWVDRYTRAIVTEANIYNANTNLMLIVTFLHEILPTGGWSFYYNIQSLRLYRYVGGLGDIIMLFDIIYIFVTLAGFYKVAKQSVKIGFKTYLKSPWNLLHFIVTVCSAGAILCTITRFLIVKWAVEEYTSEPELFVSFAYVGQLEYLIMGFIGFVVFFTNLEFLRILRFNRRVGLLTKTVAILGKPMASFGILFIIVFMAYVGFCHCIYADKLFGYSSVMLSFVSLTEMFLGSFDIFELIDQAPFFGPIMFFSYMLLIQMVLINMFIGIICDAFAAVREANDDEEESNVLSFMSNRMKNISGATSGPLAPIYSEWKTDWEVMMEDVEEQCDNCIYAMRNMESEEIRHEKWFAKLEDKKKNVLAGVIGMEYFLYETEILDALQVLERKTRRMNDEDAEEFLAAAARKRLQEKNEDQLSVLSEESTDDDDDDDDSETESGEESS